MMGSIPKKVSAGDNSPPLDKSNEAEHNRRQLDRLPFPPGGCTVSGTATSTGTTVLEHNLKRTPRHWVIYDQSQPCRLGVTATTESTISVANADVSACELSVYIW